MEMQPGNQSTSLQRDIQISTRSTFASGALSVCALTQIEQLTSMLTCLDIPRDSDIRARVCISEHLGTNEAELAQFQCKPNSHVCKGMRYLFVLHSFKIGGDWRAWWLSMSPVVVVLFELSALSVTP